MPWNISARGDPPNSVEKVLKRKADEAQTLQIIREETIISEEETIILNPALAAVPEVTQVQFLLLSLEALGAMTYFSLHWGKKG